MDRLNECGEVLRVVLQIAVVNHHHVPAGLPQPRAHSGALPTILWVVDDPNTGHGGGLDRGRGRVRRVIVDDDDLEVEVYGCDPLKRFGDRRRLVVRRHDHAQRHRSCHRNRTMSTKELSTTLGLLPDCSPAVRG